MGVLKTKGTLEGRCSNCDVMLTHYERVSSGLCDFCNNYQELEDEETVEAVRKQTKESLARADKAGIEVTFCGKLTADDIEVVIKSFEDERGMRCVSSRLFPEKAVLKFERGEDENQTGTGA